MIKNILKNSVLMLVLTFSFISVFFEAVKGQESFGNDAARAEFKRGEAAREQRDFAKAAEFYRAAIELDPYYVEAHQYFINNAVTIAIFSVKRDLPLEERREKTKQAKDATHKEMVAVYEEWARKNPRNSVYQWALGEIYRLNEDYGTRERYLLRAVDLDPKFVAAYQGLAVIAELRGDKNKQREYLKKIADFAPADPSALFNYARSLSDIDPGLYRETMLKVADLFPNDERGAQALLQLAMGADTSRERIAYFERLRTSFPPTRFMYSNAGMPFLFDSYSRTDPQKALALAEEMRRIAAQENEKESWQTRVTYQQNVVRAQGLINENKYAQAVEVLERSEARKAGSVKDGGFLELLKAEAFNGAGQASRAYQELIDLVTIEPTDTALERLRKVGANLGKTERQVNADIRQSLQAKAKPVKDFSLARYDDEKQVALSDYRGKIVLLSLWFPTCAPCRTQSPELQKILKKYGQDKFVILAINVRPDQDQMILPYLRNNKFDFVALRGSTDFARDEFDATGFPTNLLVDQQGRVVSRLDEIRGEGIRTLELSIETLLAN